MRRFAERGPLEALRCVLGVLMLVSAFGGLALASPSAALAHPSDSALDSDHDTVNDPPVGTDNCAGEFSTPNRDQLDTDSDGRGDACDTDDDGDGVDDAVDNCAIDPNARQDDADGDGRGDLCDADDDGDGRVDSRDNCPTVANAGQADADRDGIGDACQEAAPTSAPAPGGMPKEQPAASAPSPSAPSSAPPASSPPPSSGASSPGTATTNASPAARDTTRPTMRLTVATLHRLGELGAGLAVAVRCSEACSVVATLRPRGGALLGKDAARLDGAGSTYAFVTLNRASRKFLLRKRNTTAVLRVEVTDAAGNRTASSRTISIRK